MKIVVMTGATSFLGRNVLKALLQEEYEVYALVRKSSSALQYLPVSDRLHLMYGSLDELESIKRYVMKADYFIHFAWDGSGNAGRADVSIQNRNIEYSMRALKLADELECEKFVFPGSQAEYGQKYAEIKETDVCNPVSEYGKAKLSFSAQAHEFCENKKLLFIHLRIFSVYGYGDRDGTLVDLCVTNFMKNEVVELGPCQQKWNFLYIDDLVNIIVLFLENHVKTGIYNVASPDTRVLKEFVQDIYNIIQSKSIIKFGEKTLNPEGSPSLIPCIDKMQKYIGKNSFTLFEEGIQAVVKQKLKEV